jgi:antitoxin VapB
MGRAKDRGLLRLWFKSKKVEIFRRGAEIESREKGKGLARAFEILTTLPDDVLPDGRHDTPPAEREGI